MTIKVPRLALLVIGMAALWLGATVAVAFAVSRSPDDAWVSCSADALEKYMDAYLPLRDSKPDGPPSPGTSESDYVWNAYHRDFKAYQSDMDAWEEQYGQISQEWIDATRSCLKD